MRRNHTIPGVVFKDCHHGDFEHYFNNTILLWNLSTTKKRIFLCQGVNSAGVYGQYLTRQKELKDKSFPFDSWWNSLDVIPPYGKVFNLEKTAVMWLPNMSKNLKKSYPRIYEPSMSTLHIVGKPNAEECTLQNILAYAFDEFYMFRTLPILRDALHMVKNKQWNSLAAQGEFVVDGVKKSIMFKTSQNTVGQIGEDGKIVVKDLNIKELLVDVGHLSPETIVVAVKT